MYVNVKDIDKDTLEYMIEQSNIENTIKDAKNMGQRMHFNSYKIEKIPNTALYDIEVIVTVTPYNHDIEAFIKKLDPAIAAEVKMNLEKLMNNIAYDRPHLTYYGVHLVKSPNGNQSLEYNSEEKSQDDLDKLRKCLDLLCAREK